VSRAEGTCRDCGQPRPLHAHGRCGPCDRRWRREQAKRPCPRCGQPGLLRPGTGICGRCQRALRPRKPPAPPRQVDCARCGQRRPHQAHGLCPRCYQTDPAMVDNCAARLAGTLGYPPEWLTGFAGYLAARLSPTRAVALLHQLPAVLAAGGNAPAAVLTAARTPGPDRPAASALARALEAFFTSSRLALPADTAAQAAQARRSRRIAETPAVFRAATAAFGEAQLQARDRARRAGTRPRADRTLEINLTAVRDLARYLAISRPAITGWELVASGDVEAFLATIASPAGRARQLHALHGFFRWARSQHLILADPARGLRPSSNIAFHGRLLSAAEQRQLLRRWTAGAASLHPHEPAAGLLGLLHGASAAELRQLRVTDIDLSRASIRLGRRPRPVPLDPATSAALRRCLDHHDRNHRGGNPHLLVNQKSKTVAAPVSVSYLEKLLAPAGVTPTLLRVTRLAEMVTTLDPVIVAAAFGVRRGTVLHYLADAVDQSRLANL
jgi:integrase